MSRRFTGVEEGWIGPGRKDGEIVPLQLSEDGLHIDLQKGGMYEWWYFDAHLNTGHTLVVFFHASNPNPGTAGKTGIEFVLLSPDGHRKQYFIPCSRAEFFADSQRPDVRIGKNTLRAEQKEGELPVYEIFVDEKDFGCHLVYTAEVNGWKPGTGYSHFADLGYFAWIVPFARASVKGTVRDGDKTLEVTGIGYHDHNWLNFQFQRIIDYWMWGRIYSESFTVSYAYIQCNEKVDNHEVRVLMLAEGQDVILSTGEFEFIKEDYEYNAQAKHKFPRKITLSALPEFEATLDVHKILEAEDMLDNFNPFLRFIASHFLRLKPGYFRLDSDFELSVSTDSDTRKETGRTLHEIVIFKPIVNGKILLDADDAEKHW